MCTRVFNNHEKTLLTTGRNMDWPEQMDTSLYYFYSGLNKTGLPAGDTSGTTPLKWTSKYASVVAMISSAGAADGLNSEGLAANVLYLACSTYADAAQRKGKTGLSVLRWLQYVVDSFANVNEVVEEFKDNTELVLVGAKVPGDSGGAEAQLHLSISDRHGDSAIIEIFDGKYVVHSAPRYRVMTNDPRFGKQLEIDEYWRWQYEMKDNENPTFTLPGTVYSADRFARARYYVENMVKVEDEHSAVAQMFSIVRNAAVPLGYEVPNRCTGQPQAIAQTLWSTVSVHDNRTYYFGDSSTPNIFWVELLKPFSTSATSLQLETKVDGHYVFYAGCVNKAFSASTDPFAA